MAVGIRIKLPGVTQEQFDEVQKHLDPVGNPPKGVIGEAVAAAGLEMQGPPDVKEFPVHETFRP